MSYFLATGCSFTDADYNARKDPPVTTWVNRLSDKLELPSRNLAKAGASMDRCHRDVADHFIFGGAPNYVIVGGTESQRFTFKGLEVKERTYLHKALKNHQRMSSIDLNQRLYNAVLSILATINSDENAALTVNNYLFNLVHMNKICSAKSTPFVFFSLLPVYDEVYDDAWAKTMLANEENRDFFHYFLNTPDYEREIERAVEASKRIASKVADLFLSSPYFPIIESLPKHEKPIGWPFLDQLGGFTYKTYEGSKQWNPNYVIHPTMDSHPNDFGHQVIAHIYYEHILRYGL